MQTYAANINIYVKATSCNHAVEVIERLKDQPFIKDIELEDGPEEINDEEDWNLFSKGKQ